MSALFSSVVSIAATKRRRFFWAAWWSAPPEEDPFRKPDASNGGARSRVEALRAAEAAAGRPLSETEPRWAAAWARVLRDEPPWPSRDKTPRDVGASAPAPDGSAPWAYAELGVEASATPLVIKGAFRIRALATHPDRGGDEAAFIRAKRAYDVAMARATSVRKKRRRR
jgi:hypothetical protein